MKNLIRAEFLKMRTTRTVYGLFAAMLALVAFGTLTISVHRHVPLVEQEFLFLTGSITWLFVLLLGIRSFTDEFRHGTIVPTVLANPGRVHLLYAKVSVVAATALIFVVSSYVLALAIGVPRLGSEAAVENVATIATASLFVRIALMSILWAVLGVTIGLAIRHQVAAIVGSLVWIMFVEGLMESYAKQVTKFLPVHATTALIGPPNVDDIVLSALPGGLMLAGWAAAWCGLAFILIQRRDIV
jgi:ABC-type transport system involved in multi-copper enzyme maturation permease subunit